MNNFLNVSGLRKTLIAVLALQLCGSCAVSNGEPKSEYSVDDFKLTFTVLSRKSDPKLALRKSGISGVDYNVPTWLAIDTEAAEFVGKARADAQGGDGFDDRILNQSATGRTADYYRSGNRVTLSPKSVEEKGKTLYVEFPEQADFKLKASVDLESEFPRLDWQLVAKNPGYYSVIYEGAPDFERASADEIWQPFIWSERRIPDRPYLTMAFRAPLPTTLVREDDEVVGVLAHPDLLPFDPLPLLENSKFGVTLVNQGGKLSPSVAAPVLGGAGSLLQAEEQTSASVYLVRLQKETISEVYEQLAVAIYGFKDYRQNEIATANEVLDNIRKYALSRFANWNQELRGASYATDVPGAVKNVSSLNALSLALATDDSKMLTERGIPLVEYMMSREKFLFSLDPEQKIQHPSRNLLGPVAPVSELAALSRILPQARSDFFDLAQREYRGARKRNLTFAESGLTWQNSLALYRASGDRFFLEEAIAGADSYLDRRVNTPSADFSDGSFFFWTSFVPDFINLMLLWEETGDQKYLDASRSSARDFTKFIWMAPAITSDEVLVNPGGAAPIYWYLKGKGHRPMFAPEELVPSWRLSEIGLTPESSGTSSGHRAIFMANYAPWMLKIGFETGDQYLQDVARSAIVGRYQGFPGYHINTARTTIYESADYPFREHLDLSVNSFHYNHILPMASMMLNWLVTEAYVKSEGNISFPSEFIEGYAYLQNRLFGHQPGRFYGHDGVRLWMPTGLLVPDSTELNYVSGITENELYVAFSNTSKNTQKSKVSIDRNRLSFDGVSAIEVLSPTGTARWIEDNESLEVEVSAKGQTALRIVGVTPLVDLDLQFDQQSVLEVSSYIESPVGDSRVFLWDFGVGTRRLYAYAREDDSSISEFNLIVKALDGSENKLSDDQYPFEHGINVEKSDSIVQFQIETIDLSGKISRTEWLELGRP